MKYLTEVLKRLIFAAVFFPLFFLGILHWLLTGNSVFTLIDDAAKWAGVIKND